MPLRHPFDISFDPLSGDLGRGCNSAAGRRPRLLAGRRAEETNLVGRGVEQLASRRSPQGRPQVFAKYTARSEGGGKGGVRSAPPLPPLLLSAQRMILNVRRDSVSLTSWTITSPWAVRYFPVPPVIASRNGSPSVSSENVASP